MAGISIPSRGLKTGRWHSEQKSEQIIEQGVVGFLAGELYQDSGYSRQVYTHTHTHTHTHTPNYTTFGQIRQRSVSSPVKTGLAIKPTLWDLVRIRKANLKT